MTTKFNQQRKFGIEIECITPAIDYLGADYCDKHNIIKYGGNINRFNALGSNIIYEGRREEKSPCYLLNRTRPWRDNPESWAAPENCLLKKINYGLVSSSMSRAQDLLTSWLTEKGFDVHHEGYNHRTVDYWKIIYDGSLRSTMKKCKKAFNNLESLDYHGIELVSPPLIGEAGLSQLERLIKEVNRYGSDINNSCGLHVHHDSEFLSLDGLSKLLEFYIIFEGILDSLLPESRRGGKNRWAQSMQKKFLLNGNVKSIHKKLESFKKLKQELTTLELTTDRTNWHWEHSMPNDLHRKQADFGRSDKLKIKGRASKIYGLMPADYKNPKFDFDPTRKRRFLCSTIGGDRYHKLCASTPYNTVEFRHHSGTIDPDKIINWVHLTSKIMDFACHAKTQIPIDTPSFELMAEVIHLDPYLTKYYLRRQNAFTEKYGTLYHKCSKLPPQPKKVKAKKPVKQPSFKLRIRN